jgi:hypothetical protein
VINTRGFRCIHTHTTRSTPGSTNANSNVMAVLICSASVPVKRLINHILPHPLSSYFFEHPCRPRRLVHTLLGLRETVGSPQIDPKTKKSIKCKVHNTYSLANLTSCRLFFLWELLSPSPVLPFRLRPLTFFPRPLPPPPDAFSTRSNYTIMQKINQA